MASPFGSPGICHFALVDLLCCQDLIHLFISRDSAASRKTKRIYQSIQLASLRARDQMYSGGTCEAAGFWQDASGVNSPSTLSEAHLSCLPSRPRCRQKEPKRGWTHNSTDKLYVKPGMCGQSCPWLMLLHLWSSSQLLLLQDSWESKELWGTTAVSLKCLAFSWWLVFVVFFF